MIRSEANSDKGYQVDPDPEISLREILQAIRLHWVVVAVSMVGTVVVATLIALVLPQRYEAVALVQVARVGNLQAALQGAGPLSHPLESIETVIQRLESSAFISRFSKEIGVPISLSATEINKTDLIRVRVEAPTQQLSVQAAEKAVTALSELHAEQVADAVGRLEKALSSAKAEATYSSNLLKELVPLTRQEGQMADPSSAATHAQLLGQSLNQKIALNERQLRLELALSPLNTKGSHAIEEIVSGASPVFPKTKMVMVLSLIIGFFVGVAIVLFKHPWSRSNRPRG